MFPSIPWTSPREHRELRGIAARMPRGSFPRAARRLEGGILLLAGTLILTSGCSLALVDGPPDFIPVEQPIPEGACTVERTLPFADAIGAGTLLFVAATSSDGDRVRFGIVLGGALGYSAYSGFRSVRKCRSRMFLRPQHPPSSDTTSLHVRYSPLFSPWRRAIRSSPGPMDDITAANGTTTQPDDDGDRDP